MQPSNRISVNVPPEFLIGADTDLHDLIECKQSGTMTHLSSQWYLTASAKAATLGVPTACTIQLRLSMGKVGVKYFISYSPTRKPIILGKQISHNEDEDQQIVENLCKEVCKEEKTVPDSLCIQILQKNGQPLKIAFPEFNCTFYGENCIAKNNDLLSDVDVEDWVR